MRRGKLSVTNAREREGLHKEAHAEIYSSWSPLPQSAWTANWRWIVNPPETSSSPIRPVILKWEADSNGQWSARDGNERTRGKEEQGAVSGLNRCIRDLEMSSCF
jgi:hypothetical protein